jgi:Ca2+-binding RTX toxin-like protein
LSGGSGSDTLDGYLGNDLYDYTRGDGNDAIFETSVETGSNDRIRLHDVDPAKVSFLRLNGGLVIQIAESAPGAGDASSLTVTAPQNGIYHYDQYGIETIEGRATTRSAELAATTPTSMPVATATIPSQRMPGMAPMTSWCSATSMRPT